MTCHLQVRVVAKQLVILEVAKLLTTKVTYILGVDFGSCVPFIGLFLGIANILDTIQSTS